jgi:EAL domain-containing protein (putative c-di-GMP-specific phosphodiesterase class I)
MQSQPHPQPQRQRRPLGADQAAKDPLQFAFESRDRDVLKIVRNAVAAGSAKLAFQPIVSAKNSRKVVFYEGLIRVLDEAGRIIPAAHFMPEIEEMSLGRDIDCTTLRLGLDMLRVNPTLRLSLNVSARSIGDGAWRRTLDDGLHRSAQIGERLILEISESSAMLLHEVLIRFMEEMQPKGISFAVDGFGAGLISFRHLKDFFFDIAKIDRCFVRNISETPDNQVLAQALITVCHQFDMFTVAEGVETPEEATVLTQLGVSCLQGYLYGVPKFGL